MRVACPWLDKWTRVSTRQTGDCPDSRVQSEVVYMENTQSNETFNCDQ